MMVCGKTKKAGVLLVIFTLIAIGVAGIFAIQLMKPAVGTEFPAEHLFVEDTYLLKTSETNRTVNVTCTPYLTNIWKKDSGDIKVIVYVVKTSNNIADYKNTVEIGRISANTTAEVEIPVTLSENTYRIDMLIFENNKLVLKGTLNIRASLRYLHNAEKNVTTYSWDLECTHTTGFVKIIHD